MEFIKEFLSKKAIGWYVSLASFVLALITVIIYGARGGNELSPISPVAIVMLVLGMVTNVAVLIKDFKIGAFVPYIFYAITLGVLFNSEMLFVTNVMGGLDGNYLDGAFIAYMIFFALTLVTSFAAAIMRLTRKEI